MKKINVLIIAMMAIMAISCQSTKKISTDANISSINLNAPIDSASYSVGVNYGAGLRENMKTFPGGEANLEAVAEGFIRAIKGDSAALLMTPEAAQSYIQSYIMDMQTKEAEVEKEKGDRFLSENKTKDGVIATESGLQYKVLKQGEGSKPTTEDKVKVHYTGKLMDGTIFDSSEQRGEPVTFAVTQVIKGWTEVLQLMPTGSRYIVWIPSELAYGPQGAGQMIKPHSMLEFEIELLEIEK